MKKSEKWILLKFLKDDSQGKVGMPILMYLLGVPGVVCLFAWFFFFRN